MTLYTWSTDEKNGIVKVSAANQPIFHYCAMGHQCVGLHLALLVLLFFKLTNVENVYKNRTQTPQKMYNFYSCVQTSLFLLKVAIPPLCSFNGTQPFLFCMLLNILQLQSLPKDIISKNVKVIGGGCYHVTTNYFWVSLARDQRSSCPLAAKSWTTLHQTVI